VIEPRELLRRIQTRINLLYTMSEIPHAHPEGHDMRSDVSRTIIFGHRMAYLGHLGNQTIWWSQTGSNRRPHACKARALPAELWPRTRRRMLRYARPRPSGYAGHASFVRCVAAPRAAEGEAWWAWEDLNFRPHAYQARALTN
jgi:hypothetical protein